jgi:superoxide reductase
MKRRDVLKAAAVGALAVTVGKTIAYAKEYYPTQVDETLFKGINRAQEGAESELAKKHLPVIKAPEKVKAGESFPVDVVIGKTLHPMGPEHWIENLQINIGNEPAGMLTFDSQGYMKPESRFNLVLDEKLKGKTVSLIVQDQCNLHGIWESYVNVEVV